MAAWREQEQQTRGKWREGSGQKSESQRRRQLWFQVKQLVELVEAVAANRGLDELAAARVIDDALAGTQLTVAGASRKENNERMRQLLALPQRRAEQEED